MECFELIHNKGKDTWSQKIFLTFKKCNVLKKIFLYLFVQVKAVT
ncbi:hypothetical protein [Bacillus subtilis]|uniref:Uncharacterized protein n=1 Tax=Bacillus subtilis TaxID=1423 RepID=A0A8I1WIY6_BACIU|nr:hypothetical protein [Bacillus subtilis]MBO3796404.1 hypothetical protein [Bacillus subtilis]